MSSKPGHGVLAMYLSPPPYHVRYLRKELERRKQKNPRYSLRAFASNLDLDASALSRILNGKQEIALSLCVRLVRKLKLSDEELSLFLASVAEDKMNRAADMLAKALDLPLLNRKQK